LPHGVEHERQRGVGDIPKRERNLGVLLQQEGREKEARSMADVVITTHMHDREIG